jgi:class 3 adenylate cyclase
MGADEEGTLTRFEAHRRELIDPKLAEHHGRIVKTTGDGLLIEFPSVVEGSVLRPRRAARNGRRDSDITISSLSGIAGGRDGEPSG